LTEEKLFLLAETFPAFDEDEVKDKRYTDGQKNLHDFI
jgi:hypothetical protein